MYSALCAKSSSQAAAECAVLGGRPTIALVCPLLCRDVLQACLAALPGGAGVEGGAPLDHITPQPAVHGTAQSTEAEASSTSLIRAAGRKWQQQD